MKESIAEYFHYFNQSKEDYNLHVSNSSLGSLKSTVSFYDDFKLSIQLA